MQTEPPRQQEQQQGAQPGAQKGGGGLCLHQALANVQPRCISASVGVAGSSTPPCPTAS